MEKCESCGGSHLVEAGLCESCRADVAAAARFEARAARADGAVTFFFIILPIVAGIVVLLDLLFGR